MERDIQTSLPRRQVDQMEWVKYRVPLLALPETGLHPVVANKIYKTIKAVHGSRPIERAAIKRARAQRIEAALKSHRDSGVIADNEIEGEVSKALQEFQKGLESDRYELHKFLTSTAG